MIPGSFTTEIDYKKESVEIKKIISHEFTMDIYKFMLHTNMVIDLERYFSSRMDFLKEGHTFDSDLVEVFIEVHMA